YIDAAITTTYTLSLHDALPISTKSSAPRSSIRTSSSSLATKGRGSPSCARPQASSTTASRWTGERFSVNTSYWTNNWPSFWVTRSEEHTSELQSRENLVCRLLL